LGASASGYVGSLATRRSGDKAGNDAREAHSGHHSAHRRHSAGGGWENPQRRSKGPPRRSQRYP
jgi:hypothetical protein